MANPKRLLMAEQWNLFSRAIGLADKSATQRREMRRAFYAGAQCILFRVIASFAPEAEPTDEDLAVMQGIEDELSEFAELVKNGRA
jgi:hypothetical protein